MRPETLAETLRALKEKRETKDVAQREYLDAFYCVPDDLRPIWMQDAYLRGYDDAQAEAAHTEMLLREAQDEIANAKARVRELEAQIAQAEAKPATSTSNESEFTEWLEREMPVGTVIGDPKWWARRILAMKPHQQPAAVGVVGAVRYGVLCVPRNYAPSMNNAVYSTHDSAYRAWGHEPDLYRVVAIVDPDSIVPLASREPVASYEEAGEDTQFSRMVWDDAIPLYPGIAQPAQERDA
jgi:hypothetical protein